MWVLCTSSMNGDKSYTKNIPGNTAVCCCKKRNKERKRKKELGIINVSQIRDS